MPDLARDILDIGIAGGLVLLLIAGFREYWIFGPQHKRIVGELRADRDYWRNTALRALGVTEKAIERVASDATAKDRSDDA